MKKIVLVGILCLGIAMMTFAAGSQEKDGEAEFSIGYTSWFLADAFTVDMEKGMVDYGTEYGAKVISLDNDGGLEVENTRTMLSKGVDGAIMCYWDENLARTSIELFASKGIPVFSVDVPMKDTVFFGVDNFGAGYEVGQAIGQYAVDNWGGRVDLVIIINSPTEGYLPMQRLESQKKGILSKVDYNEADVEYADGGGVVDQALDVTRAILAKHPEAEYILIASENDANTYGILTALSEAGKEEHAATFSFGGDAGIRELIRRGNTPVKGALLLYPENYGKYAMRAMIDHLSGQSIDQIADEIITVNPGEANEYETPAIYIDTDVATQETLNQFYPNE